MNAITKKVVAVMAAVVMAVTAAVSVSADYVNVDSWGIYKYDGTKITNFVIPSVNNYSPLSARWLISGINPDYTYDCFVQITFKDKYDKSNIYINNKLSYYNHHDKIIGSLSDSNWASYSSSNNKSGYIEYKSDTTVVIHLIYNNQICNFYSATLALAQPFVCNKSFDVLGYGVGVYYDPGGDTYSQLIYEYGSGNQLPDVKDIKDKGSAMSKAEAAVRDKSDDLVASVESDWSAMQSTAKAGVTSLQPAAATVNSAFGLVMDELPDEVKILFVAIPILLFIGWLIGRVRE